MRWRILNLKNMASAPDALDILTPVADVDTLEERAEFLDQSIAGYDALIASLNVPVRRETLARGTRLKVVASTTTGLDHIDVAAAHELGIRVLSLRDEHDLLCNVTATAEMAWGLLLAVVRRIPWAFEAARHGHWAREQFRGHQLSGKTLGILGYGRLGRIVADYGKAFRMRVLAHDRSRSIPAEGVAMVDFTTLLQESDVLTIHIHLEEANRGLLNTAAFSMIKPGAILVNTSRGAIVDESAMLSALVSGRLAGAGLDVINGEWRSDLAVHPVLAYARQHENLVVSPHVAGATWESQRAAIERTLTMLRHHIEGVRA